MHRQIVGPRGFQLVQTQTCLNLISVFGPSALLPQVRLHTALQQLVPILNVPSTRFPRMIMDKLVLPCNSCLKIARLGFSRTRS
ncbi:hypothetical protein SCLCIDRAFT_909032 [Scleroderma citrinum Foug A]|uniref:Uncharacterized protein n=1 Tax=Scleroderma citrinum Foug A TaxID=1036808 RepID=A0A0C3A8L2_9AGAM|nr:hypothetical protein SCLCIDRAFT_909032 [Scleroderma citrinum Foug A]